MPSMALKAMRTKNQAGMSRKRPRLSGCIATATPSATETTHAATVTWLAVIPAS
jgi:hypothetical protein